MDDSEPEIPPPAETVSDAAPPAPVAEIGTDASVPEERLVEVPLFYPVFAKSAGFTNGFLSFFYSLTLHCGLVGVMAFGLNMASEEPAADPVRHYSFRVLSLTPLPPNTAPVPLLAQASQASRKLFAPRRGPGQGKAGKQGKQDKQGKQLKRGREAPPEPVSSASVRRPLQVLPDVHLSPAEHTLLQPDAMPEPTQKQTVRVPEALIWPPKKSAPNAIITAPPQIEPNAPKSPLAISLEELKLVERPRLAVAPVPQPQPYLPKSATLPVEIDAPADGSRIPSQSRPGARSSGHLISVSDVPRPEQAMIVIPPVMQRAATTNAEKSPASDAPGNVSTANDGRNTPREGQGTGRSEAQGSGRSEAEAARPARASDKLTPAKAPASEASPNANSTGTKVADTKGAEDRTGAASGSAPKGPAAGTAQNGPAGSGASKQAPVAGGNTRLERPKDGKHKSIVLGASTSDSYPESAGVLTCKTVYTAYLQVGLPKNWILQFCLPGGEKQSGGDRGNVAALDAPWPFVIIRPPPTVLAELNDDYTLIHGLVTSEGRFEKLKLVVPGEPLNNELTAALQQWEFRPASRDGQPTTVEILLIVPHRKD